MEFCVCLLFPARHVGQAIKAKLLLLWDALVQTLGTITGHAWFPVWALDCWMTAGCFGLECNLPLLRNQVFFSADTWDWRQSFELRVLMRAGDSSSRHYGAFSVCWCSVLNNRKCKASGSMGLFFRGRKGWIRPQDAFSVDAVGLSEVTEFQTLQ